MPSLCCGARASFDMVCGHTPRAAWCDDGRFVALIDDVRKTDVSLKVRAVLMAPAAPTGDAGIPLPQLYRPTVLLLTYL